MKRVEGYYWVRYGGEWTVAYWVAGYLGTPIEHWICGFILPETFRCDTDFTEIDETRIERSA